MLFKIEFSFFIEIWLKIDITIQRRFIIICFWILLIINNKTLQKKLNISIDTYIKYSNQIEIEIIPDINKIQINDKKLYY